MRTAFKCSWYLPLRSSRLVWPRRLKISMLAKWSTSPVVHHVMVVGAKGDGPVSKDLKTRPADLTVLAKKNNGVFPFNAVYQIIDGREPIASHGTREMPIWAMAFRARGTFQFEKDRRLHLFATGFTRTCSAQSYLGGHRLSKSHTGEVIDLMVRRRQVKSNLATVACHYFQRELPMIKDIVVNLPLQRG